MGGQPASYEVRWGGGCTGCFWIGWWRQNFAAVPLLLLLQLKKTEQSKIKLNNGEHDLA